MADTTVKALKGINISFRKNEFVSILGPSGCGKTTLLNIIGGLDKYTSGDLFINGKSTKDFTDRDWDVYRNHRIGFIFQSYNLIPHQTVLENVELALTLSGVSKKERKDWVITGTSTVKYEFDTEGVLTAQELKEAIANSIKAKNSNLVGNMASQGTTPRQLTDLIGSLCDLTSGSGDKGTPVVFIKGYFDNLADE